MALDSYNSKRNKLYRKLNPLTEQQKEQRKVYYKIYYEANRERLLEYQRQLRQIRRIEPNDANNEGFLA